MRINKTVCKIGILLLISITLVYTAYAAGTTNISILYGWNGSEFVPAEIDAQGRLKTSLNLSRSVGMFPYADSLYDIGSSSLRWSRGYFMSLIVDGNVTLAGNINISGLTFANGTVQVQSGNFSVDQQSYTLFVDTTNNRVGIGALFPNVTLHVSGSANITGYLEVSKGLNVSNGANILSGNLGVGTATPNYLLQVAAGTDGRSVNLSNVLFVNASSGRVGIGTTAPTQPLNVLGDTNITGSLFVAGQNLTGITNISVLHGWNQSGNSFAPLAITDSGALKVSIIESSGAGGWVDDGSVVRLATSADSVGIGTISPSQKLEVAGHINVTGTSSNSTFQGDVKIIGRLYGGSPIKVGSGINISVSGEDALFVSDGNGNKLFRITDTGMLNITSSAGNTSFDSETLFIDATNNRVGIGTASPNYLLQVASGTDGRSVNLSNVFYVNGSSGNVGIGTTGPGNKLDIITGATTNSGFHLGETENEGGYLLSTQDQELYISGGVEYDSGAWYARATTASMIGFTSGRIVFYSDSSLTDGNTFTPSARMWITSGGNVGIGTTSPNYKLDVAGTINASGLLLTNNTFSITQIGTVGVNTTNSGSTLTVVGTFNASGSGTGPGLYVNGAGNVGIGTTDPNYLLQVASGADGRSVNLSNVLFVNGSAARVGIGIENATKQLTISGANGALLVENAASLANTGPFVSMAANSYSNDAGTFRFEDLRSSQSSPSFIWNAADNSGTVLAYDFQGGGASRIAITQSGNVAIGAASPNVTFHVSGNANVTGTLSTGSFEIQNAGAGTMNISGQTLLATDAGRVGIATKAPDSLLTILGNELTANAILHINASDNFNSSIVNAITLDHILKSANSTNGIGLSILFRASDNNSEIEDIANITAVLYNATNGSELSAITFATRQEGINIAEGGLIERLRIDGRGRLGINDSTPTETLDLTGTLRVVTGSGTEGLFVGSNGRVGVGALSPNVTFHVSGNANVTGTLSTGSFEIQNAGAGTMNISGQTLLATDAGNVGIGNRNPNVTLHVSGRANITGYLEVGSGLNVSNGMNVLSGNVGIGTGNPTMTLHVVGSANISQNLFVGGNITTGGADFAEMMDSDDALQTGDVVCFADSMKVKKCGKSADKSAAGVVSSNPTIIGNKGNGKYPIGIVGLVPAKVIGPVNRYDLLTTSAYEGYAKKATFQDFGAIIGKALEPCKEEACKINVLVSLS